MGFLDDAKKKLGDAVDQHGDKIGAGLDKAAQTVDDKTGGKHSDKIQKGVGKAKEALDGLDGKRDDISDEVTEGRPVAQADPSAPAPRAPRGTEQ